ncbi:MAG: sulfotransferase domain-containing protein [Planctomycetota bacterium]
MKLPTFLIIGAQKCGTTTLYRDLLTQPGVFLPYNKEPTSLVDDAVLTDAGLAEYAALYAGSKDGDARGDASTGYTRMPRFTGAAERARKVLGPNITLIYLVREPVARIVSHHHHWITNHPGAREVDRFVDEDPNAIAFTRYAWQLEPWIEQFGREKLHVYVFEEFVTRRAEVARELAPVLGFEPRPERIDAGTRFNAADQRSVDAGWAMALRETWAYRRLRPMLPNSLRDALRLRLAPKAPPPPPPPSAACVDRILDALEDDHRALAALLGRPHPIWDPAHTRAKYERLRTEAASRP